MNEIKLSGQQQKILDYMEAHNGRVTVHEINSVLKINGATARLSEMRKKGLPIDDRDLISPTGTRYKEYFLKGWRNEK